MRATGSAPLRRLARRTRPDLPRDDQPKGLALPLASLRARLDDGSQRTRWVLHADGTLGRGLICESGAAITFPLATRGTVHFRARAQLMPHDWRDCHGSVRAWVAVVGPAGTRRELFATALEASDRARPGGRAIAVEVPGNSTALILGVDPVQTAGDHPLRRAAFLEPALVGPMAAEPAVDLPSDSPLAIEPPLISVLMPVHDPPLEMLEEAIASVTGQTYAHWELRLTDDGSTRPEITQALQRHASSDPRIHLTRHERAEGISAATNRALAMATGTYIALLDHDDTLTLDALAHVADTITRQPDLDMIYSDEAVVAPGLPPSRHIKPGWSPEHMSALMYTCHLGVYRRKLAEELGGFQPRFDGCQDYDFVLRLTERTDRIAHIPRILYHWRAHARSTAGGDQAKPYAYLAQPRAISEHLDRQSLDATVQFGKLPGLHRIVHRIDPGVAVDLVVIARGATGIAEAISSWIAQPHPRWRVVLAGHEEEVLAALEAGLAPERVQVAATSPGSTDGAALAAGAAAATAEQLVIMQTPAVGLTHDWLTRLIGYSQQPGIAAAGPVLLSPDGRIQQAGVALPAGVPLHLRHGEPAATAPPVVFNLSAVSGILATSRAVLDRLGGFDPALAELSLIDYCLRAREAEQRIVLVPDARLRVSGPDPATNDLDAMDVLRARWARHHHTDPYYNPSYRTDRGDFILQRFE
jgi:GT2 family glycosyltransferase